MDYMIETQQLTKCFKRKTAVNQLNLKVPKGSIFAFLGANGAGKTTTIKMIMNIIAPTSGRATVCGVDSLQLSPSQLQSIGYVSESQELPEWMSCQQLLDYCKPMYPSWDDNFCQALIKQFDLPLTEKLRHFSRGMKMKAALICAMAFRPQLLILDEPFSGLDPLVREELIDGLLEITSSESWTIFVSSHDINEVERLADWVGILHAGEEKIIEGVESLQNRFKHIEILLGDDSTQSTKLPENFISCQQKGRVLRLIHDAYQPGRTDEEIKCLFPTTTDIKVQGMTLREIFIVLAKQYRLTSGRGGV